MKFDKADQKQRAKAEQIESEAKDMRCTKCEIGNRLEKEGPNI